MNKFKIGDKVKLNKPSSKWNGLIGTIEDIVNDRAIGIKFDKIRHLRYFPSIYVQHFIETKADNASLWDELEDE